MSTIRARRRAQAAAGIVTLLALATVSGCASTGSTGATPTGTSASAAPSTATVPPATATLSPQSTATDQPLPSNHPSAGVNVITTPTPGATVSGPDVTISGSGSAFEGTLNWEIVPAGGTTPVASGFTNAGANGTPGPFTFTATVPTGTLTVAVWEPDMSNGESGTTRHNLVTVTFTVS